jgi:ketosteroid isomerase-like protein
MTPLEIMEKLSASWYPDAMGQAATAIAWTDVFAPDIVLTEPSSLPHGGVHQGLDAFLAVQAGMAEHWEQRIEDADYWQCAPDRVSLRIVITWTARVTGRSVTLPMIDVLRFGDGKVVAIEAFVFDTAALLATLSPAITELASTHELAWSGTPSFPGLRRVISHRENIISAPHRTAQHQGRRRHGDICPSAWRRSRRLVLSEGHPAAAGPGA